MRRMGFTHHPGALPFVTVRRAQWANRLTIGENIEIHGEHGCDMPPIAAKVVEIIVGEPAHPPEHLASVYRGQGLCSIALTVTDEPWSKIGESWHRTIVVAREIAQGIEQWIDGMDNQSKTP